MKNQKQAERLNKTFYVTYSDEVDGLVIGMSGLHSDVLSKPEVKEEVEQYLREETYLSGVVATFHCEEAYNEGRYDDAELYSIYYEQTN